MKRIALLSAMFLFPWGILATEFTVEKTASGSATVKVDGRLFAEYVVDQANKPYVWPIYGPTGKSMTRAFPMQNVDGEPHDHVHHRGITFGHENIGDSNTWQEAASFGENSENDERRKNLGRIRHREFKELAGGKTGVIHALSDYLDPNGSVVIVEERRLTFRIDGDSRVIDVDLDLIGTNETVKVDDKKDAGLSIRVPHSMCVDAKQGGVIVDSEGHKDADVWGKRAKWCDFNGPVDGEHLGIALLNHPSSFRHPTPWHARTYGLFAANAFGTSSLDPSATSGAIDLKRGERLNLRHRFLFHKGDEKQANIAAAYEAYARENRAMR